MYTLSVVFLYIATLAQTEVVLQLNDTEVVHVNVLFRHGQRTPANFYPTDPYQNVSYWPEGIGQLTNLGKAQAYELGKWLRQRYDVILTDSYSSDVIHVQSSDYDRTLMTADCVMAGMYPPSGAQQWSDVIDWQPIPVHTIPRNMDKVLAQRAPCPAYYQEVERVFMTDEKFRLLNQTYADLLQWATENGGTNFSFMNMYILYDDLLVESSNNLTLPEWTNKVYPHPMLEANLITYRLIVWNQKLTRLKTGLLLSDMIQNMLNKVHSNTSRNVNVYSAHDENISNFLLAVGAFNNILPPYASCLMLELRVDSIGNYYVSLYYRNSTTAEPYLLTVGGCTPLCPLDTFISILQPIIPTDWDEECRIAGGGGGEAQSYLITVLAIAAVAVIVILAVSALYYFCKKPVSYEAGNNLKSALIFLNLL